MLQESDPLDPVGEVEPAAADVSVVLGVAAPVFGFDDRAPADASQTAAMVVVWPRGRGTFAGLQWGSISQAVRLLQGVVRPVVIFR